MTTPEPITSQDKLHQLADHLQASSKLLRELASERVLPLADDQAQYWSDQWQTLEKEADEAEERGEYTDFGSMESAIDCLHRQV